MLVEGVELVNQLLVVVKAQELLHLLDLCNLLLLASNLFLHFLHHSLIV